MSAKPMSGHDAPGARRDLSIPEMMAVHIANAGKQRGLKLNRIGPNQKYRARYAPFAHLVYIAHRDDPEGPWRSEIVFDARSLYSVSFRDDPATLRAAVQEARLE